MKGCSNTRTAKLFTLMTISLLSASVQAHSPEQHAHAHAEPTQAADTTVHFVEVPLLDQHGHTVNLKQDLVADKLVVMSFVYTSCTTVCPVVSGLMKQVQSLLGERVGAEVQLVSISVDPLRDTPSRLQQYSQGFNAGDGWIWLTGTTQSINQTLKGLGAWAADYEAHPPLIMVGDGRSNNWSRFYGFTAPEVLVAKVDELSSARHSLAKQDPAMHTGAHL
ncbi:SCO family protein [Oceanisphaera sp. IT1-181]|uniref:SCO family protein n=1 Tax=Oceanisphaera sp. IT1-181 TaxID=3081199 RepID=UPI0029CA8472|nr:SCO family protein [Oceanisphaera sp. IT1-181]